MFNECVRHPQEQFCVSDLVKPRYLLFHHQIPNTVKTIRTVNYKKSYDPSP